MINRKHLSQNIAFGLFRLLSLSVVGILFAILGFIIYKGVGVIDWEFLTSAPTDPAASFTELHIGSGVKQKIWISCSEQNPRALKFFDFIVAKLLLLYGQSEP